MYIHYYTVFIAEFCLDSVLFGNDQKQSPNLRCSQAKSRTYSKSKWYI